MVSGESHDTPSVGRGVIELPDDLQEGDLLAIPCTDAVALRNVRGKGPAADRPDNSEYDAVELTSLAQLA